MNSFLKNTIIFLLAFVCAGLVSYHALRLFTRSAEEVVLPELTGKNIIYVLETLTNMGLNAKLEKTDYDAAQPKYAVISQSPPPGTTLKKGRDVVISISKGNKESLIPDLRQMDLVRAKILLEKNEFKPGRVSYTWSDKAPKDKVIDQYPTAFSTAHKGSGCDLLVSLGRRPSAVVMPNLTGLAVENAFSLAGSLNLNLPEIKSGFNPLKAQGIVLSQLPMPGSRIVIDRPVSITVNALKGDMTMPSDRINRMIMVTHSLESGYLNSHVRLETDMFGPVIDLYNEHMKPGTDINLLIPAFRQSQIRIYIDHQLVRTISIDPWRRDLIKGDFQLWESLPLQSYPLTSLN